MVYPGVPSPNGCAPNTGKWRQAYPKSSLTSQQLRNSRALFQWKTLYQSSKVASHTGSHSVHLSAIYMLAHRHSYLYIHIHAPHTCATHPPNKTRGIVLSLRGLKCIANKLLIWTLNPRESDNQYPHHVLSTRDGGRLHQSTNASHGVSFPEFLWQQRKCLSPFVD